MKKYKGSVAPITILVAALLLIGGLYLVMNNKSDEPVAQVPVVQDEVVRTADGTIATISGRGASTITEDDRIKVLYPKGGENFEIGKSYDIQWSNYKGQEPLTIALQVTSLDNKASTKIIASNVLASSNSYKWTVGSESLNNKYKIEVYPAGGRPYVGISKDFFKISGEQLVVVDYPVSNSRLDMNKPVIITGKARKVFDEGEFDVIASYLLDGQKKVVANSIATCNLIGNGCDWISGNLVDFKATLDLSKSPVCSVNIELFKRNQKIQETVPFYILPIWLYGDSNCR